MRSVRFLRRGRNPRGSLVTAHIQGEAPERAETVAATSANVALGRKAVSQDISPDPQWSVVQIVGTFVDGDERQQTIRTVSRGVPLASADLWTAKVENSVLHIETH